MLDSLFHFAPTVQLIENRHPASFPQKPDDLASLSAWPASFEAYYNDHFGLRSPLVRGHNYLMVFWLNALPARHVTIGQQGWLFFPFDGFSQHYQGITSFDQAQVTYWRKVLREHRDICRQHGVFHLVVIVPNKQSLYPEFLPEKFRRSRDPGILDRFLAELHPEVELLDLRQPLLNAKQSARVYQMTDAHWNSRGALIGADEILKRLETAFPKLPQLDLSSYVETRRPRQEGGDLARLVGLQDRLLEDVVEVTSRHPAEVVGVPPSNLGGIHWTPGRAPSALENRAVFPQWRAVVAGDSFGPSLLPFLMESFHRVFFCGLGFPYRDDHAAVLEVILEAEKPQIFIEEMVEREFGILPWSQERL